MKNSGRHNRLLPCSLVHRVAIAITLPGVKVAFAHIPKQMLLAAYEFGIKEVLIPADNLSDISFLPAIVKEKLKITPVQRVDEVLKTALVCT